MIEQCRQTLQKTPNDRDTLNNLAWLLATQSNGDQALGMEAVELAEKANILSGDGDPAVADTLALAHAAAGDLEQARRMTEKALALAVARGDGPLAAQIRERIAGAAAPATPATPTPSA